MNGLLKKVSWKDSVDHYLDDFLFAGVYKSNDCAFLMQTFSRICEDLGVPLAANKIFGPTHVLVYLELEIYTWEMCVRIPFDKLHVLREALLCFLGRKKITLKELLSLVGSLNFCARAIPGAVAFNRRFYDASVGMNSRYHLRVSCAMQEDMRMWLIFLNRI